MRKQAGRGVLRTMRKLMLAAALLVGSVASADQDEFCEGFEEGFKAECGDNVMLPLCPMVPLTPLGSTDYREGLKAGMNAGKRRC